VRTSALSTMQTDIVGIRISPKLTLVFDIHKTDLPAAQLWFNWTTNYRIQ